MIRLRWTSKTAPHLVLEITRSCNIVCPACYKRRRAGAKSLADIEQDLDVALLRHNPNYRWCARLGQLGAARVEQVPPDAFARYSTWRQKRGARLGGVKPCVLTSDLSLAAILRGGGRPLRAGTPTGAVGPAGRPSLG